MNKKDIKNLTFEELEKAVLELGYPGFRTRQIFRWLYQRGASGFNKMNNLPKSLRDNLEKNYSIGALCLCRRFKSADKTEKFLFKLHEGSFIESVLIPAGKRKTICLSTQVGCKFACSFCASGAGGFKRNLTPSEITAQILFSQHELKHKLTNYVFMGMGEPLDNFENLKKALMIMTDSKALNIGARRITISTCGIIEGIEQLAKMGLQVNLSVSLHAANDKLRNRLLPISRRYPLAKLIKACERFRDKTGRMLTLEYVLIKGKNDSPKDADELSEIAKLLRAKVNLIAYSEIPRQKFQSPKKEDIDIFMKRVKRKGVKIILRQSKGKDIQAACGQLAAIKRE